MENKIIELLRKNGIGEEKAIYLAHELLFLLSSEQLKTTLYAFRDMHYQNIDINTIDEYIEDLKSK